MAATGSDSAHVLEFINEQFYVDDGCSATESPEEAISILKDTRSALGRFNIRLHKICSSSEGVVNAFPDSEREKSSTIQLEATSFQTALGLIWDTSHDKLILRSKIPDKSFTRIGVL